VIRQFLVLVGVIAVVLCALLLSMYVLDFMKFPELREHLTKLASILGIATGAGLLIMLLVRAAEKK
jgi:cytochrome bd-type quinol oxidase subunit 2